MGGEKESSERAKEHWQPGLTLTSGHRTTAWAPLAQVAHIAVDPQLEIIDIGPRNNYDI